MPNKLAVYKSQIPLVSFTDIIYQAGHIKQTKLHQVYDLRSNSDICTDKRVIPSTLVDALDPTQMLS